MRQAFKTSGEFTGLVSATSYDPYGKVIFSLGENTPFGYTGEMQDQSLNDIVYLRARHYAPSMGKFLSRDTWNGNYTHPLSLNKWNYVSENPINRTDPFGLWELAPGFNLSDGGIYGKGLLEMQGSPTKCGGTCLGPATTRIPIFAPQVVNGKLYNDQIYGSYEYTSVRLIKQWIEEDVLQRTKNSSCFLNEIIIPKNTNDWKVINQYSGTSYAFSKGAFEDFVNGIAMANGFDQGVIPLSISFVIPHDQAWSIAVAIFSSSKLEEKNGIDLDIYNEASLDRDRLNANLSLVIGGVQGWSGAKAMNQRGYSIIIQENNKASGFYRAIIETRQAFTFANMDNGPRYLGANFVSYEKGRWNENRFLTTKSGN